MATSSWSIICLHVCNSTPLWKYLTLPHFTFPYLTFAYFTLLYFILLWFTLLQFTLHCYTLLYFTWLHFTLLYITYLYVTLLLLNFALLFFTSLHLSIPNITSLQFISLPSTFHSTALHVILLCFASLYGSLLYCTSTFTLLSLTFLYYSSFNLTLL